MPARDNEREDDFSPPWKSRDGFESSSAMSYSQSWWSSSSSCPPSSSNAQALQTGNSKQSADKEYPPELHDHGIMAAMVVPPVIVLLAILGLCFFLARRRRSKRRYSSAAKEAPVSNMEMAGNDSVREYRLAPPPPSSPPPIVNFDSSPAPIIVSDRNNAYLTGLDTSSQGSRPTSYGDFDDNLARRSLGGTFLEPPPPYGGHGDDPPPLAYEYEIAPLGEHTQHNNISYSSRSPFADPFDDDEEPDVADGMQYRRDPFADPESPVSDIGSRPRFGRRNSDVSDL